MPPRKSTTTTTTTTSTTTKPSSRQSSNSSNTQQSSSKSISSASQRQNEATRHESKKNKGVTYDTYTQIISDTIEELSDIYIPKLLKLNIFYSNEDAEAHFETLKEQWMKRVEESGIAEMKPPTPYEIYLQKLQEQAGEVVYHTDRAADFIHQKLNPSDYNNIANPRRNPKNGDTHSKIMTTFDMIQFGKPPTFLPSTKKEKKDPALRQEQKHSKKYEDDEDTAAPPSEDTFDSSLVAIQSRKRAHINEDSTQDEDVSTPSAPFPLQVDGAQDSVSQEIKEEEYDEENDSEMAELFGADPEAPHFLVGQYRTKPKIGKHKWKMALENVIVHIDGKDQLFSIIDADLQW